MKESDNVIDHINKILIMAKDLFVLNNLIIDAMHINIILNGFPFIENDCHISQDLVWKSQPRSASSSIENFIRRHKIYKP